MKQWWGKMERPIIEGAHHWLDSLTLAGLEHQNPRAPQLFPFFLLFSSFSTWLTWVLPSTISCGEPSKVIKIHEQSSRDIIDLYIPINHFPPFFVLCPFLRHLPPHPCNLSSPTMSSTNSIINNKDSIDQTSWTQLVRINKSKHSRKITIHHSESPLPPDDFVLFPQDVVKEKHSSIRDAKPRKSTAPKKVKVSSSPMPRHHVIEPSTLTPPQRTSRRPSDRPSCLTHMSTVNCTVACANADTKPLAYLKTPPKAPSPPRLPTPDVSDVEEDDLWSCCGSSWSSLSKESVSRDRKIDSTWDEMSASPNPWHQGNRIY